MYESPIDIIYNDIQYKVVEELDKNIVSAVQSYGIDVNKEELLKALRYDRQQYEKGYADAKSEQRWIPCSERLPEEKDAGILKYLGTEKRSKYVLATVKTMNKRMTLTACTYDGTWNWNMEYAFPDFEIVAWMPMPEPYNGEDDETVR